MRLDIWLQCQLEISALYWPSGSCQLCNATGSELEALLKRRLITSFDPRGCWLVARGRPTSSPPKKILFHWFIRTNDSHLSVSLKLSSHLFFSKLIPTHRPTWPLAAQTAVIIISSATGEETTRVPCWFRSGAV